MGFRPRVGVEALTDLRGDDSRVEDDVRSEGRAREKNLDVMGICFGVDAIPPRIHVGTT